MTLHLVGLDLSLASTGIARVRLGSPDPVTLDVVGTPPVRGNAGDYYPASLDRLRTLAGRIVRAARVGMVEGDRMVVAIELPAHSTGDEKGYHLRAGLWWMIYHLIEKEAIVVLVSVGTLKRYATGKGNAPKDHVLAAAVRAHPTVGVVDNNEADAITLAAMLARHFGHPIEISAQRVGAADALDAIHWPAEIRHPDAVANRLLDPPPAQAG